MIVQILPDPAQVDLDRNVESPQLFRGANPRQHQQLGRSESSRGKQDLCIASERVSMTSMNVLHSHRLLMFEQDPGDLSVGHHAQPHI